MESVRPPYKYIVSLEHLPGHIYFNKFLFSPTGWGQVIGLCSKLVHIDLCFLLGCHGLCFQKATSVYIASLDRILKQALSIFLPFCQHGGGFPLAWSVWWILFSIPLTSVWWDSRATPTTQCSFATYLGHWFFNKFLWPNSGWEQVIGQCSLTSAHWPVLGIRVPWPVLSKSY